MKDIVKKIPAIETGHGVLCTTRSGKQYRITQSYVNVNTSRFTLWQEVLEGFKRIGVESSPTPLYGLIPWDK